MAQVKNTPMGTGSKGKGSDGGWGVVRGWVAGMKGKQGWDKVRDTTSKHARASAHAW